MSALKLNIYPELDLVSELRVSLKELVRSSLGWAHALGIMRSLFFITTNYFNKKSIKVD